jgi:DNA-binding transcriptional regulator GbsR (MarR family)
MRRKQDIERFYDYIDSLGLRFPVADLAKATGYSKGNVSEYLKSRDASDNFMKAVYKAFPKGSEKVLEEMTTYSNIPPFQTKGGISEQDKDRLLQEKDARIKELKELVEFLKTMIQQPKEKR